MAFDRIKKLFSFGRGKMNRPVFQDEETGALLSRRPAGKATDHLNGHPIDTFMQENRYAEQILRDMKKIMRRISSQPFQADWNQLSYLAKELKEIEIHYRRVEEVLFPYFEHSKISRLDQEFSERYQEVKRLERNFAQSLKNRNADAVFKLFYELSDSIRQIISDEDQILFPTALHYLSADEWKTIRVKSAHIGYPWSDKGEKSDDKKEGEALIPDGFHLDGGFLTLEAIDSLLNATFAEITVFNKEGVVVYFNYGDRRRYPRKTDLIGKPLKEAFSGKNYTNMKKILTALKAKKVPFVEFWFPEGGKQIYTRYVPLFDGGGNYNGAAELIVDLTDLQRMTGTYSSLS